MKELLKSKLDKYDYKYSSKKNKITVKLGLSLEINIDFSYPDKVIIKDKLVSWNFLTGVIEMSLKSSMIFNTVGIFIITTLFAILKIKTKAPNASIYFLFLIVLVAIWTIYYMIKAENFKKMIISWIENLK